MERVWPAALGPTAVLLLRQLAARFPTEPTVRTTLEDLAAGLGVGTAAGRPLANALGRLERFGLTAEQAPGRYLVYRQVPQPGRGTLTRLPASLQTVHHRLVEARLDALTRPVPDDRAEAARHALHQARRGSPGERGRSR